MKNNELSILRDFQFRYQKLSQTSGYNLVYDTLALIQDIIPCRELNFTIVHPKTLNLDDVEIGTVPLFIATPFMAATQGYFFSLFNQIDFAKRFGSQILSNASSGNPIQAYSFSDHAQHSKGLLHYVYKFLNCSDILVTASLLARHQFLLSKHTDSYYGIICTLAHYNGKAFNESEKLLLALCFDIFVEDFKNKIRCHEHSPFLPFVTGEKIDQKTKLEALFDSGTKFSPRELATIRACFDLKQQQHEITRTEVTRYMYLRDSDNIDTATLKKAMDKVDYDLKKIKEHLLRDFPHDSTEYKTCKDAFGIEHITDVFQTYAYFGLYADEAGRYASYLSRRLDKYS